MQIRVNLRVSVVLIVTQFIQIKPQMNADKYLRKDRIRIYTNVNESDVFIRVYLCSFVVNKILTVQKFRIDQDTKCRGGFETRPYNLAHPI